MAGRQRTGALRPSPPPQRLQGRSLLRFVGFGDPRRDESPGLPHCSATIPDLKTVQTIVTEIETQFGKSRRIWVMDRGMISDESLAFLGELGAVICWPRGGRAGRVPTNWGRMGGNACPTIPRWRSNSSNGRRSTISWHGVGRGARRTSHLPPSASRPGTGIEEALWLIDQGKLKKRDKILERVGRLRLVSPRPSPL